jgi:nitrite reductase (NADH) large subunit
MSAKQIHFFDNYTKYEPATPLWVWQAGRGVALAITLVLAALLMWAPPLGLKLFWGIAIPAVPLLLVVAPGLWRQVCPMALMNQTPRTFGFSRNHTLPDSVAKYTYPVAVMLFVGLVALRVPLLNHAGPIVGVGLIGVLALAFAGGLWFKGRSGWCGTFCPLGPIQRIYGHAPLAMVPNGYCPTCVGCQKHCYDFNPRAAIFSDIHDDDPRFAAQRRLFMGLLPGLIAGFFLQGLNPPYGTGQYVGILLGACCASAGLHGFLSSFVPVGTYRVSAMFGAAALGLFYWFAGPIMLGNVLSLFGLDTTFAQQPIVHSLGAVSALTLLGSGLRSERHYRQSLADKAAATHPPTAGLRAQPITIHRQSGTATGAPVVTDRASGQAFEVKPGLSLLKAVEAAGLKINKGCGAGICGSDAVAICDGGENLSPPGPDELATLRRLGLEGKARLACVCEVKGPVTIDRDPHSATSPALASNAPKAPAVDKAKRVGIERVVVVGNGVAGMGAIEALRRDSPSLQLTLVSDEPEHFYNRMAIAQILSGEGDLESLRMVPPEWHERAGVTALRRTRVTRIDRAQQVVHLSHGIPLPYDRLILATGASAMTPSPTFLNNTNTFVMRTSGDALAIKGHVARHRAVHAMVIGGGVLGVEGAEALRKMGMRVTLLERAPRLMANQLDEMAARKLNKYMREIGVKVITDAFIGSYEEDGRIHAVHLEDGRTLKADLFVACLGIVPNAELARQAGIAVGKRAIAVDSLMTTSDPNIYAVGDVAEVAGPAGLWPVAASQATAAVSAIWGEGQAFETQPLIMHLKSKGLDLRAYGINEPAEGDEVFTSRSGDEAYWRLIVREGKAVGGTYVGPAGSSEDFTRALRKQFDLKALRKDLSKGRIDRLAEMA